MKIETLIELLQEEQRIHPYAEVVIGDFFTEKDFRDVTGVKVRGTVCEILTEPS